jgi:hypothetical protein
VNAISHQCPIAYLTTSHVDHDSPIVLPSIVVPQSLHSLQRLKTLYPFASLNPSAGRRSLVPLHSNPHSPVHGCGIPPRSRGKALSTITSTHKLRHRCLDYPRKQPLWAPLFSRHLPPPFPFPWRSNEVQAHSWTHKRKRPCEGIYQKLLCPPRCMHGNASFSCY